MSCCSAGRVGAGSCARPAVEPARSKTTVRATPTRQERPRWPCIAVLLWAPPSLPQVAALGRLCYESSTMRVIGMIGLGLLGHALASRLLAAGHALVGYDVLPERVAALARPGGKAAEPGERRDPFRQHVIAHESVARGEEPRGQRMAEEPEADHPDDAHGARLIAQPSERGNLR